jgi:AGCS family alanine or glycine:cation symporter
MGTIRTILALGLALSGLYFTVRFRFFQILGVRRWVGRLIHGARESAGGVSQGAAACAALAGTVGTGNLVGVAAAISVGGAGAVFWMWVSAILGMATAFAENVLGIRYRVRTANGGWSGGPMAYLARGLARPGLAKAYAAAALASSFAVGALVQSNAIAAGCSSEFGVPPALCAVILGAAVLMIARGGAQRVSAVAARLVPAMVGLYVLAALCCLAVHAAAIPTALSRIVTEAFTPRAGVGGALLAVQVGVARGVFSNEAGLGTSVLIHSQADSTDPAQAGCWAMMEVFLDTLVVCTLTALVILTSGADLTLRGAALTLAAFRASFGAWGGRFVALTLTAFAFSTVLSWSWYGQAAAESVFGRKGAFVPLYALAAAVGCLIAPSGVWDAADFCNFALACLNLAALWRLADEAVRIQRRL